ncbi:hypothetical protein GQR58_030705 [Nymphon striatum]|nr:hypothetical protein GQR58_030705 [Nymphon striatum]
MAVLLLCTEEYLILFLSVIINFLSREREKNFQWGSEGNDVSLVVIDINFDKYAIIFSCRTVKYLLINGTIFARIIIIYTINLSYKGVSWSHMIMFKSKLNL